MKREKVILVNKNNKRVGVEEKIKAHKKGILHRAFSILIFNSKERLLIQQRAKTKYHSMGLWSNTVDGHPKPNETYYQAAKRRLKEEMGFDCELKKLFCFVYKENVGSDLIESEYDCVFIGKFDGKAKPNKKEVMNYKLVSIDKLKKDIKKNPNKYSVWLKIIIKKFK